MTAKQQRILIILLLTLMGFRGMLYGVLIPFDRSPDEGFYFKLIKAKQMELRHASESKKEQVAAQIALSQFYLRYPDAPPTKYTLRDFPNASLEAPPPSIQIYYLLTAGLLEVLDLPNVIAEIYVLRGISVICGVLVVWFAYLMSRELFPANPFLLLGVPALIVFIPQFAAMNGVVSNDKFTEVFTAAMFWLMVKIFKRGLTVRRGLLYLFLIGMALAGKRTAVFTLPLLVIAIALYYWKWSPGWRFHLVLAGIFGGLPAVGYGLLKWLWPEALTQIYELLLSVLHFVPFEIWHFLLYESYSVSWIKFYAKFFTLIYWSFWGLFGYFEFHIHHNWYTLAALAQILSGIGLLKWIFLVKKKTLTTEPWQPKILYLCAASVFWVVLIMLFRSVIVCPDTPFLDQGRRLFPVLLPISVLTLFGLDALWNSKYHRLLGGIGLLGLLMMDAVCLSEAVLLNFHLRSLW